MSNKILRFGRKETGHEFYHSVSWSRQSLPGLFHINDEGWVPRGATAKQRWFAENEICEQRPKELQS